MTTKLPSPQIHKPNGRNLHELHRLLKHYPPPKSLTYDYGTAGFRYPHRLLPPVMVRMGILASLRSASTNTGEGIGIMITASHNPEEDNGIKLSDSNGGMMGLKWEKRAIAIANASPLTFQNNPNNKKSTDATTIDIERSLSPLFSPHEIIRPKPMVIHIGIDTRPHSRPLAQLAIRAALAMGATVVDHGCVTTPQLHWSVLRSNPQNMQGMLMGFGAGGGSGAFEREYLEGMVGAYGSLLRTKQFDAGSSTVVVGNDGGRRIQLGIPKKRRVLVDCACGVGGLKVPLLQSVLQQCEEEGGTWWTAMMMDHNRGQQEYEPLVHLVPVNLPGEGPLNENCGAEFVQKQQKLPRIYTEQQLDNNNRDDEYDRIQTQYVASLDGDADRIVFHYKDEKNKGALCLLDGDKIAVLVANFIQEELTALAKSIPEARSIRCGVVQTAYANGASTHYLKNVVGTKVMIAKTGVKFVHEAAHSNFDIGVYFEANGHGTVLFGPKFYEIMAMAEQQLLYTSTKNRATIAWQRLRVLPRLINQAVGDALSDLLLVDAILFLRGLSLQDWNTLYRDMPSRQCKVRVRDRAVVTTNENETRATSPVSLQKALDSTVASLASTSPRSSPPRAFVRPSGTENVVRVYAEASSQKDADLLASEAAALVYKLCDGVGECPNIVGNSKL